MKGKQEVLRCLKTARGLVSEGWTQGESERDGRYCVFGALQKAGFIENLSYSEEDIAFICFGYTVWGNPIDWNDRSSRTKQEVVDAFDVTIERVERSKETS